MASLKEASQHVENIRFSRKESPFAIVMLLWRLPDRWCLGICTSWRLIM